MPEQKADSVAGHFQRKMTSQGSWISALNQIFPEAPVPGSTMLLASHVSFGIGNLTISGMFSVNLKSIKVK